jgi:hypothetical protein
MADIGLFLRGRDFSTLTLTRAGRTGRPANYAEACSFGQVKTHPLASFHCFETKQNIDERVKQPSKLAAHIFYADLYGSYIVDADGSWA